MQTTVPERASDGRAIDAHLEDAIGSAREGLAEAKRVGNSAIEQSLLRCLTHLARAQAVAHSNVAPVGQEPLAPPREEVSSAAFAAGDGANDAQVVPEDARGKPGNWPSF